MKLRCAVTNRMIVVTMEDVIRFTTCRQTDSSVCVMLTIGETAARSVFSVTPAFQIHASMMVFVRVLEL